MLKHCGVQRWQSEALRGATIAMSLRNTVASFLLAQLMRLWRARTTSSRRRRTRSSCTIRKSCWPTATSGRLPSRRTSPQSTSTAKSGAVSRQASVFGHHCCFNGFIRAPYFCPFLLLSVGRGPQGPIIAHATEFYEFCGTFNRGHCYKPCQGVHLTGPTT